MRPSAKAGVQGKKWWVGCSSCWFIVVCGGGGDGGSGCGGSHGGHGAGLSEARSGIPGLVQMPKLKPRKVTRNGEATSKASRRAGLSCHGLGASV